MISPRVRALFIVYLLALSASAANAVDSIYWAREIGDVRVGPLAGSGDGPASTVFSDGGSPCGVAIDPRPTPVGQKIYWANFSTGEIRRSNLDGSSAETVVVGQDRPCGVAIDPVANRIYWANFCGVPSSFCPAVGTTGSCGCGTIMGVTLAGSFPLTPDPALFTGEDGPSGVAIDPAASQIYWTNQFPGTTKGTVRIGPLSGGSASTLFDDEANPLGLAIDPAASKIYWANLGSCCSGPGTIRIGNLDGSGTPVDLFAGELGPAGVAIDPTAVPARIYWATFGGGELRVGSLDGSGVAETLFNGEGLANFPALSRCGDGLVIGSEQCDDGGNVDGDGCWATCTIEGGWSCSGAPSVCTPPPTGCATTGSEGTACDDDNACTTQDTCRSGRCVGGPPPNCDDRIPCTDDQCDPAIGCTNPVKTCAELPCRQPGVCNPSTGACTYKLQPEGLTCSDGNACTLGDTCCSGTCTGTAKTCAPPDSCHTPATCDPSDGACVYPRKPNGTTCSDASACTTGDSCTDGTCRGAAKDCDDRNVCTTDSCNPGSGCKNTYNTSACDDGNACTTSDKCSYGTCRGGAPLSCNDNNPCTIDACNRISGCSNAPNTATCSDGNPCTKNDRCSAGACLGGSPPDCDDGNPCTVDSCTATGCKNTPLVCPPPADGCHSAGICSATTGACYYPQKADGSTCSDGDPCTQGETCRAGACGGGSPPPCPQCTIEADTMVRQSSPTQTYNSSQVLEAANAPTSQTLFRVRVTSAGPVGGAKLRLTAKQAAAVSAGSIHQVSCSWQGSYVNWSNKPALGPVLDTKEPAGASQQVEFDVSSVITAAGTYCFGIDNPGGNASYVSRESATQSIRPILLLQSACACAR